jgi:probable phosphoglycerate mutase
VGKVYITRHGETEYNLKELMQGSMDIALSDRGIQQAERLRDRLADISFNRVLVSPLIRAKVTAETILQGRNESCEFFDALKEMDFGELQGKAYKYLEEVYPELHKQYWDNPAEFTIPQGESFRGFEKRVLPMMDEIAAIKDSETILIVCHGITKLILVNALKGIPLEQLWDTEVAGNTALTMFESSPDGWVLQYENDQSHLV